MMGRWLSLAWVMLVGCYAPEYPLGSPCSTDSECPTTQRCIANVCGGSNATPDAPSGPADADADADTDIDAPTGDPDGDGISGSADNCPGVANADQGNEDGDKFGDVCDPCPIEANDTPSDPDGDGVADSCDPMPNMAGNQILLFEGFHGTQLPTGWMVASVSKVGDEVRIVASGTNHSFITPPPDSPTKVTIMTRVTIEQTTGNNDADFGVSALYNPANDDSVRCDMYSPTAQQTANRDISIYDSMKSNEIGSQPFAWVTGTPYLVSVQRAGTTHTCRASAVNGTPVMTSGTTTSVPTQQKFALRAYAASALVSYVLIVTNP